MRWRRRREPVVWAMLGVLGGMLGAMATPWMAARLGDPSELDSRSWTVIVPGRDAGLGDMAVRSATGLVDGALVIGMRPFGRPDQVTPLLAGRVARATIRLAPGSGPLGVSLRSDAARIVRPAHVEASGWAPLVGQPLRPYKTPRTFDLAIHDGYAHVDGVPTSDTTPGTLDLSAIEESVAIEAMTLAAADGTVLLDADFGPGEPGARARLIGALVGAMTTLAGGIVLARATSRAAGVAQLAASLLPPALAILPPYGTWVALQQQLYLGKSHPSALRAGALVVATLPLVASALLASGVLRVEGDRQQPTSRTRIGMLAAMFLAVAGLAARELPMPWTLLALPGAALLALPAWTAHSAGQPVLAAVRRDAPALLVVAGLGWELGLLPLLTWRGLCWWQDAPTLLQRSARAGADALFVTLLLVPVGAEAALRATYVTEAWSPETLAGAGLDTKGGRSVRPTPFWEDSCGAEPRTIHAFGGSSTGGAFQFEGRHDAFWPGRLHGRLCAAGHATRTQNHGNSGLDTFDIGGLVDEIYAQEPPALSILYVGVNDVLTKEGPWTRKQRAARLAEVRAGAGQLDALGARSRLLTGLSLLARPRAKDELVEAVPVQDAEENLRAIVATTRKHGGRVLLVPEWTQSAVHESMAGYTAMMARLAQQLEGVAFLDPYDAHGRAGDALFLDRNHLGFEGSEALAATLEPKVVEMLGRGEAP